MLLYNKGKTSNNDFLKMKEDISIKKYTTFKIGGKVKYFVRLKKKEDIKKIIKEIKEKNLSFFVLGGGSNILGRDKDYNGVVLKIENKELEIKRNKIFVGAGVLFSSLSKIALKSSLTGLEWAYGIPGTVGGAVYGNAAAFGSSIKDCVESVEVFNVKKVLIEKLPVSKCKYENKESIFKRDKDLIIISAVFKLKKGEIKKIKEKMDEYLSTRKEKHPVSSPSAGCIFKNCEVKISDKKILKEFPEIENFNKKNIIPVSYLIEKANLKGRKVGGAKVSNKHANFIINAKNAKREDVLRLIGIIKKEIYKKFKIRIEEEVQKM